MSAAELKAILDEISRAPPLPPNGTLAETRAAVDAMQARYPVAPDLLFEWEEIAGVSCLWSRSPVAGSGVVLYTHGGCNVLSSAWGMRTLAAEIGRAARARTLSVDFRLAPEHPFPAALEDVINAYRGLLEQGFLPANIAIAGDSAGGGLALAALLMARDQGLPLPCAALLIEPWVDLECSGRSMETKAHVDPILSKAALLHMAAAYLGQESRRNPLASPLYADLSGLPPLFVQIGTDEVLFDDAARLAQRAGEFDLDFTLRIWPHMFHGWQSRMAVLSEARAAVRAGGEFIGKHLSPPIPAAAS